LKFVGSGFVVIVGTIAAGVKILKCAGVAKEDLQKVFEHGTDI
jgi:hypothetical protein